MNLVSKNIRNILSINGYSVQNKKSFDIIRHRQPDEQKIKQCN